MTVADANGIFEASRAGTTNPRPTAPMLTPADPRKLTFCLKASSSSELAIFIVLGWLVVSMGFGLRFRV